MAPAAGIERRDAGCPRGVHVRLKQAEVRDAVGDPRVGDVEARVPRPEVERKLSRGETRGTARKRTELLHVLRPARSVPIGAGIARFVTMLVIADQRRAFRRAPGEQLYGSEVS